MDEALQNVLDYIETEGNDLSPRDFRSMLLAVIEDCESQLDAIEDHLGPEEE